MIESPSMPSKRATRGDPTGRPDLTDPRLYKHWHEETIRFGDQDSLGHVNNASIATYCESARLDFSRSLGHETGRADMTWVLARLAIDYRAELHYPGAVRIGTAVGRLGTSSCTLVEGLFVGKTYVATSEAAVVMIDMASRKSTPIPPALRRRLTKHLIVAG
jgi:acyl-CoA thioester hydrolase